MTLKLKIFFVFLIVVIFSGCAAKVPVAPVKTKEIKVNQKLPVKVALLISPETKNYVFKGRSKVRLYKFPLGNILEKASLQIFSQVFEKVVLVRSVQAAKQYEVYLEPKIENFHFRYDNQLSYVAAVCKIKVHITFASGERIILEKNVESPEVRKGPWVINFHPTKKLGEAATEALVSALEKFASEIVQSPSVKQAIYEIRSRKRFFAKKEKQIPFSTPYEPKIRKKETDSVTTRSQKVSPFLTTYPKTCVKSYPNRYLFISVVYDYDELSDLDYVKNDIALIKTLGTCYLGVPKENIKALKNPSVGKLKKELKRFTQNIALKDAIVYFYYSGHGVLDSKGKFYLLPSDASIDDEQTLKDTAISIDTLMKLLGRAKGYKVAFIDACRISPPWKPAVLMYKPPTEKTSFIFSTKQGQVSNADREHRHSAFTRALYEMARAGVVNMDLDGSGYVEVKEIEKPLRNWLKRISASPEQSPDVWGLEDIPLFPVE